MLDFGGDWLSNEPDWWYDKFYCSLCEDLGIVYADHGTGTPCPVCWAGEDY